MNNRPDGPIMPTLDRHRRVCARMDELQQAYRALRADMPDRDVGDGDEFEIAVWSLGSSIKRAAELAEKDLAYCEAYS